MLYPREKGCMDCEMKWEKIFAPLSIKFFFFTKIISPDAIHAVDSADSRAEQQCLRVYSMCAVIQRYGSVTWWLQGSPVWVTGWWKMGLEAQRNIAAECPTQNQTAHTEKQLVPLAHQHCGLLPIHANVYQSLWYILFQITLDKSIC